MIYADIAAVVMVALFLWLVPVRRNGIPGLRGRGKLPVAPPPWPPEPSTGHPAPSAKVITLAERRGHQPSGETQQPGRETAGEPARETAGQATGDPAQQPIRETTRREPKRESAKRARY